jgi:hypothetical protein
MWKLADQQIDSFISRGECEFMGAFAQPFAVLVVSDLLGVPPEDRTEFRKHLIRVEQESGGTVVGGTDGEVTHSPLAFYTINSRPISRTAGAIPGRISSPDSRKPHSLTARCRSLSMSPGLPPTCSPPDRKPRCDCSATRSNWSASAPTSSNAFAKDRSLIPNFVEECLRTEGPVKGDFRLAKQPTKRRRSRYPGRHLPVYRQRRRQPGFPQVRKPRESSSSGGRTPGYMWHSAPAAMLAPAPPWRGRRRSSASTACSTGPATFASRRKSTGRPAHDATAICQPSSCAD